MRAYTKYGAWTYTTCSNTGSAQQEQYNAYTKRVTLGGTTDVARDHPSTGMSPSDQYTKTRALRIIGGYNKYLARTKNKNWEKAGTTQYESSKWNKGYTRFDHKWTEILNRHVWGRGFSYTRTWTETVEVGDSWTTKKMISMSQGTYGTHFPRNTGTRTTYDYGGKAWLDSSKIINVPNLHTTVWTTSEASDTITQFGNVDIRTYIHSIFVSTTTSMDFTLSYQTRSSHRKRIGITTSYPKRARVGTLYKAGFGEYLLTGYNKATDAYEEYSNDNEFTKERFKAVDIRVSVEQPNIVRGIGVSAYGAEASTKNGWKSEHDGKTIEQGHRASYDTTNRTTSTLRFTSCTTYKTTTRDYFVSQKKYYTANQIDLLHTTVFTSTSQYTRYDRDQYSTKTISVDLRQTWRRDVNTADEGCPPRYQSQTFTQGAAKITGIYTSYTYKQLYRTTWGDTTSTYFSSYSRITNTPSKITTITKFSADTGGHTFVRRYRQVYPLPKIGEYQSVRWRKNPGEECYFSEVVDVKSMSSSSQSGIAVGTNFTRQTVVRVTTWRRFPRSLGTSSRTYSAFPVTAKSYSEGSSASRTVRGDIIDPNYQTRMAGYTYSYPNTYAEYTYLRVDPSVRYFARQRRIDVKQYYMSTRDELFCTASDGERFGIEFNDTNYEYAPISAIGKYHDNAKHIRKVTSSYYYHYATKTGSILEESFSVSSTSTWSTTCPVPVPYTARYTNTDYPKRPSVQAVSHSFRSKTITDTIKYTGISTVTRDNTGNIMYLVPRPPFTVPNTEVINIKEAFVTYRRSNSNDFTTAATFPYQLTENYIEITKATQTFTTISKIGFSYDSNANVFESNLKANDRFFDTNQNSGWHCSLSLISTSLKEFNSYNGGYEETSYNGFGRFLDTTALGSWIGLNDKAIASIINTQSYDLEYQTCISTGTDSVEWQNVTIGSSTTQNYTFDGTNITLCRNRPYYDSANIQGNKFIQDHRPINVGADNFNYPQVEGGAPIGKNFFFNHISLDPEDEYFDEVWFAEGVRIGNNVYCPRIVNKDGKRKEVLFWSPEEYIELIKGEKDLSYF